MMMIAIFWCAPRTPLFASRSAWATLSYRPGSHVSSSARSVVRCFFSWSTHPPLARVPTRRLSATMRRQLCSAIRCPPLCPIFESKIHESLEQLRIRHAACARGLGKILGRLEVRIGIGLEHVYVSLRGHAKIHASIAGHAERPIDAAREPVEHRQHRGRQILRGMGGNT